MKVLLKNTEGMPWWASHVAAKHEGEVPSRLHLENKINWWTVQSWFQNGISTLSLSQVCIRSFPTLKVSWNWLVWTHSSLWMSFYLACHALNSWKYKDLSVFLWGWRVPLKSFIILLHFTQDTFNLRKMK